MICDLIVAEMEKEDGDKGKGEREEGRNKEQGRGGGEGTRRERGNGSGREKASKELVSWALQKRTAASEEAFFLLLQKLFWHF